jgi:hypothetical protein
MCALAWQNQFSIKHICKLVFLYDKKDSAKVLQMQTLFCVGSIGPKKLLPEIPEIFWALASPNKNSKLIV